MIKYFKENIQQINNLYIIIDDKNFNYKIGIKIEYLKKNKITSILLLNKKECDFLFNESKKNSKIEIDEFELMFNEDYANLLKEALKKHKEIYKNESLLNKIVKRYNLLNLNNSQ